MFSRRVILNEELTMALNRKIFFVFVFIFAVGVCAGSFFEVFMTGTGKDQLMDALSGFLSKEGGDISFSTEFFNCYRTWLLICVFMMICPLLPPLTAAVPVICLLKGLSFGFSATMLVETFGLKGGWYILCTMLPHSLIQIPVMCFLACLSAGAAHMVMSSFLSGMKRRASRRDKLKTVLRQNAGQYVIIFAAAALCLAVSCVIETLLN